MSALGGMRRPALDEVQARRRAGGGRAVAYLAIGGAVAAWGGSFVAARILLHAGPAGQTVLSPTVLAGLRFSLAALCFVAPLARAIRRHQLTRRDLLKLAALGQIAVSLYFWLQYTGVALTNAGVASVLVVGLAPLATLLLAWRLGQERLRPRAGVALLCGAVGVALIALRQAIGGAPDVGFVLGALCLVANAFAFAVYTTLSKRWLRGMSPLVLTGGTLVSGALGLLVLALLDPAHNRWEVALRLNAVQWGALLYLAVICSVGAYAAYNFALTRLPASRAAFFLYCEPVVALALGAGLLGETLTWPTLAGVAAIGLSVVLVQRTQPRSGPAPKDR